MLNVNGVFVVLFRFKVDEEDEAFYEIEIEAMKTKESNTMFVDFSHVMRYNDLLQKAISEEFLRLAFSFSSSSDYFLRVEGFAFFVVFRIFCSFFFSDVGCDMLFKI